MYILSWVFYCLCFYLYSLQSSLLTRALTINRKPLTKIFSNFLEYEIRDLEYTNSDFTTAEASLWIALNTLSSAITSQCSSSYILGGYGIVGAGTNFTRVYTSLPLITQYTSISASGSWISMSMQIYSGCILTVS